MAKPTKTPIKNPPKYSPDSKLTEKQHLFVEYYAQGMSQTAAARHAGYKSAAVEGNAILKKPHVAAHLAKRRARYEKSAEMSRKRVMEGLQYAIDQAKLIADPIAQISGWREVAKLCGYYEPTKHRLEVTVNGQVVIQRLQSLTDQQLLALAEGRTIEGELVDAPLALTGPDSELDPRGVLPGDFVDEGVEATE